MGPNETPEQKETSRIEAFSDGVFAVAVTLLILTIGVPPLQQINQHTHALGPTNIPVYVRDQWPFFLAYAVSFLNILVMWANHHSIFKLVLRTDRILMLLNGILLMVITFFDYPTAVVAAALHENQYQRFAALFYTGTILLVTIVYNIFWRYIAGHRNLLDPHVDPGVIDRISREYRFGPLFYLAAFAVAYFSALAGIFLTLLLALYFTLTARFGPVHSPSPSHPT